MKNLNLYKLPTLQIAYLAPEILVIIASIVINQNKKFKINCSKKYKIVFIFVND